MAVLWFLCGVVFTLTSIILLLPWLRTIPGLSSLPALPWQAGIAAVVTAAAVVCLCAWLQPATPAAAPQVVATSDGAGKTAATAGGADSWAGITNALGRGAAVTGNTTPATKTAAGPMSSAIASLQARLAKGGGSADDWELLAKSYEFLGRPVEASKARAHQLPVQPANDTANSAAPGPSPAVKVLQ